MLHGTQSLGQRFMLLCLELCEQQLAEATYVRLLRLLVQYQLVIMTRLHASLRPSRSRGSGISVSQMMLGFRLHFHRYPERQPATRLPLQMDRNKSARSIAALGPHALH
jgi:hypothetical protein